MSDERPRRLVDPAGFPQAHRYEFQFCGHCPNVHLLFFDYANKPICHATLSLRQARNLARVIEENDPNFREIE